MAKQGWVDIVHPSGLTSEVLESTVATWELQGWTRADNGSEEVVVPQGPLDSSNEQPGTVEALSDPTEE